MILNNIEIKIIIVDTVEKDNWVSAEKYWIDYYRTHGYDLVNGTSGGEGGDGFRNKKHTEITKIKCREAAKKSSKTKLFGLANGKCKLTDYQVLQIIQEVKDGNSKLSVAKKYSISDTYVAKLVKGVNRNQI